MTQCEGTGVPRDTGEGTGVPRGRAEAHALCIGVHLRWLPSVSTSARLWCDARRPRGRVACLPTTYGHPAVGMEGGTWTTNGQV